MWGFTSLRSVGGVARGKENERTRERENERGEIIRVETSPKDIVDS